VKIVCSISMACRIMFFMVLAGFVLGLVVAGGGPAHTDEPSVPSARVTHCVPWEEVDDPCSRT
jgi:hypothetical protein